jgi:hypothetical protein
MTQPNSPDITLYTIADSGFFLGLIGLVNSLRITGCHHPVVVLDCGLTPRQRAVVRPHCHLVDAPPRGAINPTQYKAFAHLLQPRGVVVIIDSDIIVARSLDSILRRAVDGRICAFPDWGGRRWFPEWQQLFGLRAQLRREVYVNAGFVAWSTVHWPHLLERWWECCERTFASPTIREGAANTGPLAQADQDALNALLMSEIPAGAVALEPREAEAFRRNLPEVEILDAGTLASRFAGHPVTLLHNNGAPTAVGAPGVAAGAPPQRVHPLVAPVAPRIRRRDQAVQAGSASVAQGRSCGADGDLPAGQSEPPHIGGSLAADGVHGSLASPATAGAVMFQGLTAGTRACLNARVRNARPHHKSTIFRAWNASA